MLSVEIERLSDGERWRQDFTAPWLEDLTRKSGSFKPFSVLHRMLLMALASSSDTVTVELLTQEDLELLRKHGNHHSTQANTKPTSANDPLLKLQRKTASSSGKGKRFLILTYMSEFDRVHYPLPLVHDAVPDASALKATIQRLREELRVKENKLQRKSTHPTNVALTTEVRRLTGENETLKAQARRWEVEAEEKGKRLVDLEAKLAQAGAWDIQSVTRETRALERERDLLRGRVEALEIAAEEAERRVRAAENVKRRAAERAEKEHEQLHEALREARMRVRELTSELALVQQGRAGLRSTSRPGSISRGSVSPYGRREMPSSSASPSPAGPRRPPGPSGSAHPTPRARSTATTTTTSTSTRSARRVPVTPPRPVPPPRAASPLTRVGRPVTRDAGGSATGSARRSSRTSPTPRDYDRPWASRSSLPSSTSATPRSASPSSRVPEHARPTSSSRASSVSGFGPSRSGTPTRGGRFDPTAWVQEQREREAVYRRRLSRTFTPPSSRPVSTPSTPTRTSPRPRRPVAASGDPIRSTSTTSSNRRNISPGAAVRRPRDDRYGHERDHDYDEHGTSTSRGQSPSRALRAVQERLARHTGGAATASTAGASLHAGARDAAAPETTGATSTTTTGDAAEVEAPADVSVLSNAAADSFYEEVEDIDARLQKLQAFLKQAKAGAPPAAPTSNPQG